MTKKTLNDIILSVKPVYAEKIFTGEKTVELRRRFPVANSGGAIAYIYSSFPTKAIVGMAFIREVLKLSVEQIWIKFENSACIERSLFDEYFEGREYGHVIIFDSTRPFLRPLPLNKLCEKFGFKPPQSFLYAKHDLKKALEIHAWYEVLNKRQERLDKESEEAIFDDLGSLYEN